VEFTPQGTLHRCVAGFAPGAPGYREIVVRPPVSTALTSASARHLTPYGEASVAWEVDGDHSWDITVHVDASALVLALTD
jgi:alpha-L-rhamnosidase